MDREAVGRGIFPFSKIDLFISSVEVNIGRMGGEWKNNGLEQDGTGD